MEDPKGLAPRRNGNGQGPGTFKRVLSSATWAVSMGIAEHDIPRFFRKYAKGVENAWDDLKVLWGSVAVL